MNEDWSRDLLKLTTKGGKDLGKLSRVIKQTMFREAQKPTRVGEPTFWQSPAPKGYVGGRLRGNWQIQENSAPSGQLDRIDKTGAIVDAEISAGASEDGVTYFVNNLPYAKKYDTLDGMVRLGVLAGKRGLNRMIREIKK